MAAVAKNYLIEDGEKYERQLCHYMLAKSKRVVSFSKSPEDAYNKAKNLAVWSRC